MQIRRILAWAITATWIGCSFAYPRPGATLEVWVLPVGIGESVLIREPAGRSLLFDGGPGSRVLSLIGQILPPWQRTLDLVLLSHTHSDHIQGLTPVLERYDVGRILLSDQSPGADVTALRTTARERGVPVETVSAGPHCRAPPDPRTPCAPNTIPFGAISLQILRPSPVVAAGVPSHPHDADLVVKVSYGSIDLLLTGDLDEKHEAALVATCMPPSCSLAAELLQVPHHGSRFGLTPAFLAAVHPETAVIPVGTPNRYGHPHPDTLARLQAAAVRTYRTDTDGTIYIQIHPRTYAVYISPPAKPP